MLTMHYFYIIFACLSALSWAEIDNNLIPERDLPFCDDLLKKASRNKSHSHSPILTRDLQGTWVSQSCETRPGPEYVTRIYKFDIQGNFKTILHKYTNDTCQEALYSLSASGKVRMSRRSILTPGGTEAEYLINSIHVVLHSVSGQRIFQQSLFQKRSCSKLKNKILPLHEATTIYQDKDTESSNKTTCENSLSWNELQLMHLEIKKKERCRRKLLFMGDLHTSISKQDEYRPTAYQEPLVNRKCVTGCKICKTILSGQLVSPPLLDNIVKSITNLDLDGHWSSFRCEVQRYGMFLTRKLSFRTPENTWNLEQHYFADPNCKMPVYKILGSGSIIMKDKDANQKKINFNITNINVTPDTAIFAHHLNGLLEGTCGQGPWKKGEEKSILPTGGCRAIGIVVPTTQKEIVKQTINNKKMQHLFLGQSPTLFLKEGSDVRPTSWSPPLRKCKQRPVSFADNTINYLSGSKAALTSSGAFCVPSCLNLVCILLLCHFVPE